METKTVNNACKIQIVDMHWDLLNEAFLTHTHNLYFLDGYSKVSFKIVNQQINFYSHKKTAVFCKDMLTLFSGLWCSSADSMLPGVGRGMRPGTSKCVRLSGISCLLIFFLTSQYFDIFCLLWRQVCIVKCYIICK